MIRVLLVEDRPDDAELVMAAATRGGLDAAFTRVSSYAELDEALRCEVSVALTDHHLPGMDVVEVFRRIQQRRPGAPIIVVSGAIGDAESVELLRLGAADVLLKDRLARLGHAIESAVAANDLAQRVRLADRPQQAATAPIIDMLQHSPVAIGVYDHAGEQLVANTRFARLLDDGLAGAALLHLLEADTATEVQVGASTYLVSAFEIADHVVRPGRALLLTEITAQKTVEAELRELDRARSELVNTVTHELRTPLTSIVGYTEILMDRTTEDDGDTRRLLEVIDRNDRRLLDMVANLLQLSALDASPDWLNGKEVEQVDLNAVVAAVHEVLLPQARSGGLELDVRTEPALPPVAGDSAQLERVLLNLGSNAIKFSAAGGIVTICTGTDSGHVFAEVVDQGMGMSEEDIAHLGDKFFRTRSARGVQGTGLGLAVVRTIVERHRGTLSVASEVGVGTRMRISFPRAHQRVGS